ncbi:rCG40145 [Rattus norvegicus]|uniref:RCG40145 n=1 Tax=Rattus norvegicus TaxID=10116 RepID=A6IA32_RAT|nr:rCG40145 [Rattus norvegicus]
MMWKGREERSTLSTQDLLTQCHR